jgi:hypothetical protein
MKKFYKTKRFAGCRLRSAVERLKARLCKMAAYL